jgi:hypothetical protein
MQLMNKSISGNSERTHHNNVIHITKQMENNIRTPQDKSRCISCTVVGTVNQCQQELNYLVYARRHK